MIRIIVFLICLWLVTPLSAETPFQVEKQKLKLSLEYENYVDILTNEIRTTGVKGTYLVKMKGPLVKDSFWTVDLQSGAKTNFDRTFTSGTLSPLIWSNRLFARTIFPVGNFHFSGGFYFRNKWLADSSNPDLFVDVFGGVGFTEIAGNFQAGYSFSPNWDMLLTAQKSGIRFDRFKLSDSDSVSGSARLSRSFSRARVSVDLRMRSSDYRRPLFTIRPLAFPTDFEGQELQQDSLREAGFNVELMSPFYLSSGYYYQDNNSNNAGFSYINHRVVFMVGTELTDGYHFQAYGILESQDFADGPPILQVPVLLEENEYNTMAASLTRTMNARNEVEIGFQRLTSNSSFTELDTSKYILYIAYNYRF